MIHDRPKIPFAHFFSFVISHQHPIKLGLTYLHFLFSLIFGQIFLGEKSERDNEV